MSVLNKCYLCWKSPLSSSQCVGLLGQTSTQKVLLRQFSFSRFLVKTLQVNYPNWRVVMYVCYLCLQCPVKRSVTKFKLFLNSLKHGLRSPVIVILQQKFWLPQMHLVWEEFSLLFIFAFVKRTFQNILVRPHSTEGFCVINGVKLPSSQTPLLAHCPEFSNMLERVTFLPAYLM